MMQPYRFKKNKHGNVKATIEKTLSKKIIALANKEQQDPSFVINQIIRAYFEK